MSTWTPTLKLGAQVKCSLLEVVFSHGILSQQQEVTQTRVKAMIASLVIIILYLTHTSHFLT